MSLKLKLARRAVFLAAVVPFSLLALPALAQTESAGPALEEVLVTAQRIEENLQTTPVAVTALTSDFLDKFDLRNVTSLQSAAPNLVFNPGTGGSSSQVSAFIRGVGEFDFLLTTDPAVGLYTDGVYMARTFGANLELADVERVEVLRGPQGTLFGKNNIGGAISITTHKPTGTGDSRAQVSFGNYSSIYLDGYTDQPLTDTLSLGVSLLYRKSDGWQVRPGADGGEENKIGGRATLAWKPSDTFDSTLSFEFISQDQTSNANVMLVFVPGADFFSPLFNGFVSPGEPCCTANSLKKSFAEGPLNRDNLHGTAFTWTNTWQLSQALTLKSITAERDTHADFGRDGDNSALNYSGDVHNEHHSQFSQEFQASGDLDRFNWVAGVYYFKERTRDETTLVTASGLFDALTALGPGDPSGLFFARYALDFNLDFDNRQTTEDYAAYLNGDFAFTDQLSLQAGIRYTKEKKEFKQFAIRAESGGSLFLPVDPFTGIADETNVTPPNTTRCSDLRNGGTKYDCDDSWNDVSPRVGLTYKWSDAVFSYVTASRGFRSGGFDGRPTDISGINDYKPEHLKSYELGLKTLLADNRVRLNTAVFYNQYEDKQVLLSKGTSVYTQNAASATIYGLETDLEAAVTEKFTLRGSLGYTHGKYDKWQDDLGDYSDRKLRNTPEWTANLAGVFDQPVSTGDVVRFLANVSFVDQMFLDGENSEILHADSRTTVDAGVFYVGNDDQWEVGVQVKNLTDEKELVSGFNGLAFFGYAEGYFNPPRRYFLTFKYNTK